MAKIYDTNGKILTGDSFPQLKIGEELFIIDNRQKTYSKIQRLIDESNNNPKEGVDYNYEVVKLAMAQNPSQIEKINKMNLSVKSFNELSIFIMAAIQEEEYDTIKESIENAKKSKNN